MQAITSLASSTTSTSTNAAQSSGLLNAANSLLKAIGADFAKSGDAESGVVKAGQAKSSDAKSEKPESELRSTYQELMSGTFYKMMLKALRSTESDLPYIGGGQTEKLFAAQFDDMITTDLSKSHGDWFSDPLFDSSKARFG